MEWYQNSIVCLLFRGHDSVVERTSSEGVCAVITEDLPNYFVYVLESLRSVSRLQRNLCKTSRVLQRLMKVVRALNKNSVLQRFNFLHRVEVTRNRTSTVHYCNCPHTERTAQFINAGQKVNG